MSKERIDSYIASLDKKLLTGENFSLFVQNMRSLFVYHSLFLYSFLPGDNLKTRCLYDWHSGQPEWSIGRRISVFGIEVNWPRFCLELELAESLFFQVPGREPIPSRIQYTSEGRALCPSQHFVFAFDLAHGIFYAAEGEPSGTVEMPWQSLYRRIR